LFFNERYFHIKSFKTRTQFNTKDALLSLKHQI